MSLLINAPADVMEILELLANQKFIKIKEEDLVITLEKITDSLRIRVLAKKEIDWRTFFLQLGAIVLEILEAFPFDRLHFSKFLVGKHHAYGDKPLMPWKELGILIRVHSKVGRLANISSNTGVDIGDETMMDTIRDLLGYSILGFLLHERIKTQCQSQVIPSSEDVFPRLGRA